MRTHALGSTKCAGSLQRRFGKGDVRHEHGRASNLRANNARWFRAMEMATRFIGVHRPVYWSKQLSFLKTNFQYFLMASNMESLNQRVPHLPNVEILENNFLWRSSA